VRTEKQWQVNVVERAELMAAETAARALGILARWATRRLENRITQFPDRDVNSNNSNSYTPLTDEDVT